MKAAPDGSPSATAADPYRPGSVLLGWGDRRTELTGALCMVACGFSFALMDAGMKALADSLGPGLVTIARFGGGFIALAVLALILPSWRHWRAGSLRRQLLRGMATALSVMLFVPALARLPLAEAIVLVQTAPVFMVILARLFLGEAFDRRSFLSVGLGLAGVLAIVAPGLGDTAMTTDALRAATGAAFALTCALCYAASFVATRGLRNTETPAALIFWPCLVGIIFALPVTALDSVSASVDDLVTALPLMLMIGVLGTAASVFMVLAARRAPVRVLAALDYLAILWGVLLGWAIWGERPDAWFYLGGALVVAAGVFATGMTQRPRTVVSPP